VSEQEPLVTAAGEHAGFTAFWIRISTRLRSSTPTAPCTLWQIRGAGGRGWAGKKTFYFNDGALSHNADDLLNHVRRVIFEKQRFEQVE